MATLQSSPFCSWLLSDQELEVGSILTTLQKQCIQNQISSRANEKLTLLYNPEKPHEFLQREAELQGSILALQFLIQLSEAAESAQTARNTPQE